MSLISSPGVDLSTNARNGLRVEVRDMGGGPGGADALVGAVAVEGFGVSALPWGEEGVEYELFAPPAACARAHGGDAHVAEGAGDDSEQAAGPPTPRCVGTLRLALLGEPTQPEPELSAARLAHRYVGGVAHAYVRAFRSTVWSCDSVASLNRTARM